MGSNHGIFIAQISLNLQFTSVTSFLGFLGVGAKFIINMNNNNL